MVYIDLGETTSCMGFGTYLFHAFVQIVSSEAPDSKGRKQHRLCCPGADRPSCVCEYVLGKRIKPFAVGQSL